MKKKKTNRCLLSKRVFFSFFFDVLFDDKLKVFFFLIE